MIETSGHLPECPQIERAKYAEPLGGPGPFYDPCICAALRACEQRVEEAMDRAWEHTLRIKQAEAYANGVAAARDAVEFMPAEPSWEAQEERIAALAAIDALKEKP